MLSVLQGVMAVVPWRMRAATRTMLASPLSRRHRRLRRLTPVLVSMVVIGVAGVGGWVLAGGPALGSGSAK